jgi:hypothetical protein
MVATVSAHAPAPRSAPPRSIVVRFQRGGQITCTRPAQARTIIANHLERARRHGVEDRVVSAPAGLLAEQP